MINIQQVIEEIDQYPEDDLRRLQAVVNSRLEREPTEEQREAEFLRELLRKGIISRIPDKSKVTPEDLRPASAIVKGPPVSQTIIEERRKAHQISEILP